jgi:peptide/nickel transport system permease protein
MATIGEERHAASAERARFRLPPFGASLAIAVLALMVLIAVFAPLLAPYDFATQNLAKRLRPPVFWGGEWAYPLGTDHLGRDILSRLIYGIQTSIAIAFAGTLIGAVLGAALGYLAARRRGMVDEAIMMLVDVQAALPAFFIALACIALVGSNIWIFIVLVSLEGWERYTKLVRGLVLSEQASGYIRAVRGLGAAPLTIDLRHVLPNIAASLVVGDPA